MDYFSHMLIRIFLMTFFNIFDLQLMCEITFYIKFLLQFLAHFHSQFLSHWFSTHLDSLHMDVLTHSILCAFVFSRRFSPAYKRFFSCMKCAFLSHVFTHIFTHIYFLLQVFHSHFFAHFLSQCLLHSALTWFLFTFVSLTLVFTHIENFSLT